MRWDRRTVRGIVLALLLSLVGGLAFSASPAHAARHDPPSALEDWLKTVRAKELELQLSLHKAVSIGGQAAAVAGLLSIAGAGFLFGAVHALLPGHGKAAVAAYAFAEGRALGGPFFLALLLALVQAASALLLVYGPQLVLGHGLDRRAQTMLSLERASYVATGLAGIWLVVSGNLALTRTRARAQRVEPGFGSAARRPVRVARSVRATGSLWPLALSSALSPSAGALIMLALAAFLGAYWAGLAALLGMALGAAVTVSVFAGAADGLARASQHVTTWFGAQIVDMVDLCRVLSGFVLLAFAATLYSASYAGG